MGFVMVISLPVILFILIVALAFYLLGRADGRREAVLVGPPVPAPPFQPQEKPSEQV